MLYFIDVCAKLLSEWQSPENRLTACREGFESFYIEMGLIHTSYGKDD